MLHGDSLFWIRKYITAFSLSLKNFFEDTRCFCFNTKVSHDKIRETNSFWTSFYCLVCRNTSRISVWVLLFWNADFLRYSVKVDGFRDLQRWLLHYGWSRVFEIPKYLTNYYWLLLIKIILYIILTNYILLFIRNRSISDIHVRKITPAHKKK